jgi:hypothetical protein
MPPLPASHFPPFSGFPPPLQALDCATQYLKNYNRPLDIPICRVMDGGENEEFEAAFEEGVKFSRTGAHAGKAKGVASSAQATYGGSGGPGVATDFDAIYNQQGADPEDWKGRSNPTSSYAEVGWSWISAKECTAA